MAFNYRKLIPYGLLSTTILTRSLPHPPNFTSTNSSIVYGNSVMKKFYAILFPLLVIFISDILQPVFKKNTIMFGSWSISIYISYIMSSVLSKFVTKNDKKVNYIKTPVLVLSSSVIFFIVTNFSVWLTQPEENATSLMQVYYIGIPFFGYELLGNICYSFVFFLIHILFVQDYVVDASDFTSTFREDNENSLNNTENDMNVNEKFKYKKFVNDDLVV